MTRSEARLRWRNTPDVRRAAILKTATLELLANNPQFSHGNKLCHMTDYFYYIFKWHVWSYGCISLWLDIFFLFFFLDFDECASVRPCKNGASCINTYGSYRCNCAQGFRGDVCETGKLLLTKILREKKRKRKTRNSTRVSDCITFTRLFVIKISMNAQAVLVKMAEVAWTLTAATRVRVLKALKERTVMEVRFLLNILYITLVRKHVVNCVTSTGIHNGARG